MLVEETAEESMADIQQEGEPFELGEEKVTPDSPTEKPVVKEPAEEGDNTLSEEDDDYKPKTSKRVQAILKERAELRDKVREMEIREQVRKENLQGESQEVIPERWSQLFSTGDPEQDREAFKVWQTMNQEEKASWKAELLAELKAEGNKETEEQEMYAQAYEEQLDELEAEREEGKLPSFDRNSLMKFITERPIFRQDGKPDFATALELMESKKPGSSMGARKSLASLKPQGPVSDKGWKTPDDLKGGFAAI